MFIPTNMLCKIDLLSIFLIFFMTKLLICYELTKTRILVDQKYLGNISNSSNRTSRIYFPIFQMIEFPNDQCLTIDGLHGTCYSRTECDLLKGYTRGLCARGFGVCCFWQITCGGRAIQNRTHFLNPLFPATFSQEMRCEIGIRLPDYSCQLRLNFVKFLISNPKRSHCMIDSLNIPHPFKMPVLCGNLTDQHIYLEANEVQELLVIITTTGNELQRYWIIEVMFIPCDLALKAPIGCLQYYTGNTGTVKTMNFDCAKYVKNNIVSRECLMSNLEYSICIRLEAQMCAIKWTANVFDMGPDGVIASQRGDFCQENYITISNAKVYTTDVSQNLKSFDRFCGPSLNIERNNRTNIPLITRLKPPRIGVTTAKAFMGPFRGASLNYEQKICIDVSSQ